MHFESLDRWSHSHAFGQDRTRAGERRTWIVIAITASMMGVEISTGLLFGSMALLADGLHMASHAAALGINACAYVYARRHAHDERYSFGTGKVNALGGYTGAVLLALFALLMAWESFHRLQEPVPISFDQAILVAVLGLIVNGASVFVLGSGHDHDHGHGHEPGHGHGHGQDPPASGETAHVHHHDHNLRSAYLHVLADALTSVLAILALLAGKYFGWNWMDPVMGVVGALLVARWSVGLLRQSGHVLLDRQAPAPLRERVRARIEADADNRVADLHLWSIGPGIHAAEIVLITHDPRPPDHYKALLPRSLGVVHATIEVQRCIDPDAVCAAPVPPGASADGPGDPARSD